MADEMSPGREQFMRDMYGNQFYPLTWEKIIECLDTIAILRKERDELALILERARIAKLSVPPEICWVCKRDKRG